MSERTPMTVAERLLALEERVARLEGQPGGKPSPAAAVGVAKEDILTPDGGATEEESESTEETTGAKRGRKREAAREQ